MRTVGVVDSLGEVGASSHATEVRLAAAATTQHVVRTPRAYVRGITSEIMGWMYTDTPPAPIATILENHRAFVRYLERGMRNRAHAEDILQDAVAKVVAGPEQAPEDEAVLP